MVNPGLLLKGGNEKNENEREDEFSWEMTGFGYCLQAK